MTTQKNTVEKVAQPEIAQVLADVQKFLAANHTWELNSEARKLHAQLDGVRARVLQSQTQHDALKHAVEGLNMQIDSLMTRNVALLGAIVELDAAALEAQRNAPVCDTLSAGFVSDTTNRALAQVRRTITRIGEDALPAEFRSENMYGGTDEEFAAKSAAFRKYCSENSIYYYAASREDFSSWVAFDRAAKAGCTKLIMEDLS